MGETRLEVILTERAWSDLEEIDNYWTRRDEAWRGEKYYGDLRDAAVHELGDAATARRGRPARNCDRPGVQEILVFGTYRILYQINPAFDRVEILHFWHSHRAPPHLD
ncbi:MAG: type II toxin-antitoxin system RelE/ParE family toxin [Chthoniobacter sp.]|nr:type II toxin-antitoxin system RelE/ParE family toxin [Chthoniobacter sp.]